MPMSTEEKPCRISSGDFLCILCHQHSPVLVPWLCYALVVFQDHVRWASGCISSAYQWGANFHPTGHLFPASGEVLIPGLCSFCVCVWINAVLGVLYIFWLPINYQIHDLQVFLPTCGSFLFLMLYLEVHVFKIFMKSNCLIFIKSNYFFIVCAFVSCLGNHCEIQHWKVIPRYLIFKTIL